MSWNPNVQNHHITRGNKFFENGLQLKCVGTLLTSRGGVPRKY